MPKIPEHIKVFDNEYFFVTTSNKPEKAQSDRAYALSKELGCPFVLRKRFIEHFEKYPRSFYYVVEKERIVIRWKEGIFFFHPSSAKMRMRNLKHGQRDYLIEILDLKGSEKILDLTLGLGSEALLMGAFLEEGYIEGIEFSKHIYTIVKYGIEDYVDESPWINKSKEKIRLVNSDYKEYLCRLPDKSFDIVYCDPMFEHPVLESSGFNPLRPFASYDFIEKKDLEEMKRVAKKTVLLKALQKDSLFQQIEVDEISGSRSSGVLYGVIRL